MRMGIQNTMLDLNNHLFMQLERLGDEDLADEELEKECKRAKAIAAVSERIIDNAKVVLEAKKVSLDWNTKPDRLFFWRQSKRNWNG